MSIEKILVPDVGGASNVEVIEILVKVGARIEAEQGLITLESDKASMDVPAPMSGVVKEIQLRVGDKVNEGDLILLLETELASSEELSSAKSTPTIALNQSVQVPDIGGASNVEVIEVLVKPGDVVVVDQGLVTLESDKASMDVPAPFAGTVETVIVKLGDKVNEGDLIVTMKVVGVQTQVQKNSVSKSEPAKVLTSAPIQTQNFSTRDAELAILNASANVYAGPAVRRLAQEFGVNLTLIKGTARKGRIVKTDVQAFVKRSLDDHEKGRGGSGLDLLPWPKVDFKKFGEIEVKPLNKIKKATAKNLHRNWVMIPHVTQFDDADITEMEAFRQKHKDAAQAQGYKLTPIVFIMKAVVACLKQYPIFNASLDETGELILKKYYNLGIAVDTPNGLVVPVIRDVDKKSLSELAKELAVLSVKARDGQLSVADMQGGNFAISSLGGIGGTAFTPIVNAPDLAILGVSKSSYKPVYTNSEFVPRLMLPLSLSYDHRVIDGADGARFITFLASQLNQVEDLIL